MNRHIISMVALLVIGGGLSHAQIEVVTTLPDYANLAELIGGDRVHVVAIVQGNQDAHFIRPKPSFVTMVRNADLLISTGLDLELWLPTVVNKSGNSRVRSGEIGYVAAAQGMHLLEKPDVLSRAEGGVHIHGNPHVTCSPINMRVAARNIATGLTKVDPGGLETYEANARQFIDEMDQRLFGAELVKILGGQTLCQLAESGSLLPFLESNEFQGKPMVEYLGGWMRKMLPMRGIPIVTYHKNWIYFLRIFGIEEAGTIEPKPGIPPSPRHVMELVTLMKERKIRIVFAANYFDEQKIKSVANSVGAEPVIVPLYVGGAAGIDDYFSLVDHWTEKMMEAAGNCQEFYENDI